MIKATYIGKSASLPCNPPLTVRQDDGVAVGVVFRLIVVVGIVLVAVVVDVVVVTILIDRLSLHTLIPASKEPMSLASAVVVVVVPSA